MKLAELKGYCPYDVIFARNGADSNFADGQVCQF